MIPAIPVIPAIPARPSPSPLAALREHWPEFLIEGWALGTFMISASVFSTLLGFPGSPLRRLLHDEDLCRALIGVAMGLTAVALIYSPWGQRSGAHMNPAVTLAFLRLGKIARWDALFYVLAQFIGAVAGVLIAALLLREAFTGAPLHYIVTLPGEPGRAVAFAAELAMSALLMAVVLSVSNSARHANLTGLFAGVLVALFITLEAPLSGMSMNPARSFASAYPQSLWHDYWIYLSAPILGMQAAALTFVLVRGRRAVGCAKLLHPKGQRCIHCGYVPEGR